MDSATDGVNYDIGGFFHYFDFGIFACGVEFHQQAEQAFGGVLSAFISDGVADVAAVYFVGRGGFDGIADEVLGAADSERIV